MNSGSTRSQTANQAAARASRKEASIRCHRIYDDIPMDPGRQSQEGYERSEPEGTKCCSTLRELEWDRQTDSGRKGTHDTLREIKSVTAPHIQGCMMQNFRAAK